MDKTSSVATSSDPHAVPFSEAVRVLGQGGAQLLWWASRTDRGNAQTSGRRKALDQRKSLFARHELLYAPAPAPKRNSSLPISAGCCTKREGGWLRGCSSSCRAFSLFLPSVSSTRSTAALSSRGLVEALFFGLKAAVLALVVEAVIRIGGRVLKNWMMLLIAALAFVGIFFFTLPFPLIVLAAGLTGLVGGKLSPTLFYSHQGASSGDGRRCEFRDYRRSCVAYSTLMGVRP